MKIFRELTQDDLVVITVEVANYTVMKTLVDQGISMEVLFLKLLKN